MYILMIAQMVSAQSELLRVNKQRHFPVILPGNYSGITHIRGDEYAVVSDKSLSNGFFVFKLLRSMLKLRRSLKTHE